MSTITGAALTSDYTPADRGLKLGEMLSVTREYLDDPNGRRHKRNVLVRHINAAQADCKRVIEQADDSFFSVMVDLTVVSGDNDYEFDLPADFSKLLHIEKVVTSGTPPPAVPINFARRHPIGDERFLPEGLSTPPTYYLRDDKIGIVKPSDSYTLRLYYSRALPRLDADADTSDIPSDYHDLVCLQGAKRGFGSEQRQMPPDLEGLRQELTAQLRTYVEDRQRQYPTFVDLLE